MRKRYQKIDEQLLPCLPQNRTIKKKLEQKLPKAGNKSSYIYRNAFYPVYQNTDVTYYDEAAKGLEAQLIDLAKAEHFIFMEYLAIEDAEAWQRIQHVLEERVKAGVEVRVFYDDMGSIGFINTDFIKKMEAVGIRCRVFNPFVPGLNLFLNNRDHRKILVIDGNAAFTGGINFADEYINEKQRFGYWKDNGVRITGKAVYSMIQMFLQMWNAFAPEKEKLDYEKFSLEEVALLPEKERGIVLPYSDHPLDSEFVGESVYINLINSAQKYIYFFTPYLIIDNEVVTALILAAKRGVDVRIITPGIPDKKMIFLVTQSYYPQLVEGGVKIFQYRPGFVHAKCAVCDDKIATVGTINLDYRSLYLHFENGLFLYNNDTVMDIKKDILDTLEDCNRIMPEMCKKNMFFLLLQGILRIFAPLL